MIQHGVEPADPSAVRLGAVAFIFGDALASDVPARRVSRIDPRTALRSE